MGKKKTKKPAGVKTKVDKPSKRARAKKPAPGKAARKLKPGAPPASAPSSRNPSKAGRAGAPAVPAPASVETTAHKPTAQEAIPSEGTAGWLRGSEHAAAVCVREFGLTAKQGAFLIYYLTAARGNGAEAARMAGYSRRTARETASRNLTKVNVWDCYRKLARIVAAGAGGLLENALLDAGLGATDVYGEADHRTRIHALEKLDAREKTGSSVGAGEGNLVVNLQDFDAMPIEKDEEDYSGFTPAKGEGERDEG